MHLRIIGVLPQWVAQARSSCNRYIDAQYTREMGKANDVVVRAAQVETGSYARVQTTDEQRVSSGVAATHSSCGSCNRNTKGIALVAASGVCFSLMTLMVKVLSRKDGFGSLWLVAIRSGQSLVLTARMVADPAGHCVARVGCQVQAIVSRSSVLLGSTLQASALVLVLVLGLCN